MFLSREELQELTDYTRSEAQCRWLEEHDYPFDKSSSGKPKVLRSYIEHRLGQHHSQLSTETPNFAALA